MKKILAVVLTLAMLFSVASASAVVANADTRQISVIQAITNYEHNTGEKVETNRYFFLMPNGKNGFKSTGGSNNYEAGDYVSSWYNDYANKPCIAWQNSGIADTEYPGYTMLNGDDGDVYYADVPTVVSEIVINNGVNYSSDENMQLYARKTVNICSEYYDAYESEEYPEGLDGFDNMIYVIDPDKIVWSEDATSSVGLESGEWYYYYGNGCYGTKKDGNEHDCLRDDHDHENLYINFDTSNTGWTDYEKVYCAIYGEDRGPYYQPYTTPALMTDYDNDGVYTYDLNKSEINLKEYARYCIYFYNDKNQYTADLTMQTTNLKDTAYATDELNYLKRPFLKWTNEKELVLKPLQPLKDALKQYEEETGKDVATYRYYFLMPNGESGKKGDENTDFNYPFYNTYAESWYNKYTDTAGVYFWEGEDFLSSNYPGYSMEKGDADGIFYADVPCGVEMMFFNNCLTQGLNYYDDIYHLARQSLNVPTRTDSSYYNGFPKGVENFDNLIYVLNPSKNDSLESPEPVEYGGEWHYYYGNGCYGDEKDGDISDCIRDDHTHGRRYKHLDEFLDYANLTQEDSYWYTGPLYYYYEDGKTEPEWFIARGNSGFSEYKYIYGVFDDYYINEYAVYSPSAFSWCIYIFDEQKFYSLEDAWDKGFVDKDAAFTQYFLKNDIAQLIGDADYDNELSVMDATAIQRHLAGIKKLYDSLYSDDFCYGEVLKYRSDFDRDGERTVLDATAIQKKLAGITD